MILNFFFLITIFGCVLSYISVDPMKSSFFLIFSMLTGMPLMSFFLNVWFSYFICLLFLSGIFVILVYFSSLSKVNFMKSPFVIFLGLIILLFFFPNFMMIGGNSGLMNFYYDVYWWLFFWIILSLIFFMNFTSYFLSFSGALRKV